MTPELYDTQSSVNAIPLHLVEEISHRVFNEYTEAIAGLSLAAARACGGELQQALGKAADRLQAYAETHRALLRPADERVDLAKYVGQLCASFAKATLAERCVHLVMKSDEIWIGSDRAWRVGLALAELIRNSARHGLGGGKGTIVVQMAQAGNNLVCTVCDDGSNALGSRPGRGVGLVRALAAELGGVVEWQFTPQGSLATLSAPMKVADQ